MPDLAGAADKSYNFYLGSRHYMPPWDEKDLYLHITEMVHRDAEGRPAHPEQAQWINQKIPISSIRLINLLVSESATMIF